MTDLLKRWAKLEPERCGSVTPLAAWVRFSGGEFPFPLDNSRRYERAQLLGAVIEAIEARRLAWAVVRANGVDGITGMVEGGDVARTGIAPTPAEALLTAYLRYLDDQVVP